MPAFFKSAWSRQRTARHCRAVITSAVLHEQPNRATGPESKDSCLLKQGLLKGLSAKVHAAKSDADGAKTELRGARASLTAVDSTAAALKHAQKELQLMAERLREERHAAAGLRRRLQQQQVWC